MNTVRLTDEKQMKTQLDTDEDLFEWIKLQAAKGVHSAQRNMGRLLYWGQQGLQRNLEEAFKYYEKAASTGDPAALYDYGVVLVKVSNERAGNRHFCKRYRGLKCDKRLQQALVSTKSFKGKLIS